MTKKTEKKTPAKKKKTSATVKTPVKKSRSHVKPGGAGKKPPQKKGGSETPSPVLRGIFGLVLLVAIVVVTGVLVHHVFPPVSTVKKPDVVEDAVEKPQYEVFPEDDPEPSAPVVMPVPPRPGKRPKVAIIIDDMGYNRGMAKKFAGLDTAITFSILPNSPHRKKVAQYAHDKGLQVMLHLPMEPMEYPKVNPGEGALLTSMSTNELLDQLNKNIDLVPYVVGVNNHMGSKMTQVSTRMYQVFTILKKRDLFFIDSRTSPRSLCKPSARLLQIPFAERDVFLDHLQTQEFVERQLRLLVRKAIKNGSAIGIGHPHKVTFEVLNEALPGLKSKVRLVKASALVTPPGST